MEAQMTEAPKMIPLGLDGYEPDMVWRLGLKIGDDFVQKATDKPIARLCCWANEKDARAIRRKLLKAAPGTPKTAEDVEQITVTAALMIAKERGCQYLAICGFTPPETFTVERLVAV